MPAIVANTKLALNFQSEVDGGKEVRDYGNGHILTQVGTAQLSTAQYKFGSSSLLLDGNSDYLSTPDNADWDFALNEDFTIDFWFRWPAVATTNFIGNGYTTGWCLQYNSGVAAFYLYIANVLRHSEVIDIVGVHPAINTWHHVAIVRSGGNGTLKIYFNGTAKTVASTYATAITSANELFVGLDHDYAGFYMNGYMDEVSIIKSARWTANFTPPTAPYGSDSNTKLLLHMNSYDVCAVPKIPTFVGTAQIDTAVKKWGESSLLLDGNSDYFTLPASDDYLFGTGDFTIEFWVNFTSTTGQQMFVASYFSADNYYIFRKETTHKVTFLAVTGAATKASYVTVDAVADFIAGNWVHVAFVRTTTTAKLYVNGTSIALTETVAFAANSIHTQTIALWVGALTGPQQYLNGSIDGLHIVKGTAIYTGAFTAPATPPYSNYYSRKAGALGADTSDLTTIWTTEEDYDVKLVDAIRVDQAATATNYATFQFKDVLPNKNVITVTWTGQSDLATSTQAVTLEAWDVNASAWDTIDTDSATAANTNFTLTGVLSPYSDYVDANGMVTCRVYQLSPA